MPEDANAEQVRRAAEQVAEAVLVKYTASHPQRSSSDRLLQWVPLIVAVGTAFWTLAIQSQQVSQNRLDIAKLETRFEQTSGVMQSVDSRLARIETTLDIITGGGERKVQSRAAPSRE